MHRIADSRDKEAKRTEPKAPVDEIPAEEDSENDDDGENDDDNDDDCPCYVRVNWIPVGGASPGSILGVMADLFVANPWNDDLFHAALTVQVPENGDCPVYVVELTDSEEEVADQKRVGQVTGGYSGPAWIHALTWPVYGIRKWRNGKIVDGDRAAPNPVTVSEDCDFARCVLDNVSRVPSIDYGSDQFGEAWTSNSVTAWLLQKCGANAKGVKPPPHGIAPGWQDGIRAAK